MVIEFQLNGKNVQLIWKVTNQKVKNCRALNRKKIVKGINTEYLEKCEVFFL